MSFSEAVEYIRSLPADGPVKPTSEEKLKFYGLYKQATIGDVEGSQPWAVQMEARAKWDAWAANKGMSKADAEKAYVAAVSAAVKAAGKSWP